MTLRYRIWQLIRERPRTITEIAAHLDIERDRAASLIRGMTYAKCARATVKARKNQPAV